MSREPVQATQVLYGMSHMLDTQSLEKKEPPFLYQPIKEGSIAVPTKSVNPSGIGRGIDI